VDTLSQDCLVVHCLARPEPAPRRAAASTAIAEVTPDAILQLGLSFWGSKTLLSAVELGVFTELGRGPLRANVLIERLRLHRRAARDFLDALIALGMLKRDGDVYSNTPATGLFLDRDKSSYVGGLLEMANARLYPFWGNLTEALRTGEPQNELREGENFFAKVYADRQRLAGFLQAMTALSVGAARAIAEKFPWDEHRTFADLRGSGCPSGPGRHRPPASRGHRLRPAAGAAAFRGLRIGTGPVAPAFV